MKIFDLDLISIVHNAVFSIQYSDSLKIHRHSIAHCTGFLLCLPDMISNYMMGKSILENVFTSTTEENQEIKCSNSKCQTGHLL